MDSKQVLKLAKVLQIALVVITLGVFIYWNYLEKVAIHSATYDSLMAQMNMSTMIYKVSSVILTAASIGLYIKGKDSGVKGLEFLVAAAGAMLVLSMMDVVIGLITWICVGISVRKMKESQTEADFEKKLSE